MRGAISAVQTATDSNYRPVYQPARLSESGQQPLRRTHLLRGMHSEAADRPISEPLVHPSA